MFCIDGFSGLGLQCALLARGESLQTLTLLAGQSSAAHG